MSWSLRHFFTLPRHAPCEERESRFAAVAARRHTPGCGVGGRSRSLPERPPALKATRRPPATRLERFEVHDETPLVRFAQADEAVDGRGGLARVVQDRLAEGQRLAVVHQPVARAHAPERWRPEFGARLLPAVLDDAVARPHVV